MVISRYLVVVFIHARSFLPRTVFQYLIHSEEYLVAQSHAFYFHPDLTLSLEDHLLVVKGPTFILHSDLRGKIVSLGDSSWYPEFGLEVPNKVLEVQFEGSTLRNYRFTWKKSCDMHILFLTDNFPPEGNAPATRTFEHARQWVSKGHKVTVITSAPNFPDGKVFDGYKNRWLSRRQQYARD